MAVSDHVKQGLSQKVRAKIMTVDMANRRVEAGMKDGSMAQVAVWDDLGNAFRVPQEGEIWILRRDSGVWVLDKRVQSGEVTQVGNPPQTQVASEPAPVTSMSPGEMKLDAGTVINANGQTFVAVDLTGIQDGWTLKWSSTLKRFVASP